MGLERREYGPDKHLNHRESSMIGSEPSVLWQLLDYIARASIAVVVYMLHWLFRLDKQVTVQKSELETRVENNKQEAARRDRERSELREQIEKHNSNVMAAIRDLKEDIREVSRASND